jgi:hypothetical protein
MGVRDFEAQIVVVQHDLLDASAQATRISRLQFEFGRDGAARGQTDLAGFAVQAGGVELIADRMRPDDFAIDDEMQVGVVGGRVAQHLGAVEEPPADRSEHRHLRSGPRRALGAGRPVVFGIERVGFVGVVKAATVVLST